MALFAIELYEANKLGVSAESLARAFGLRIDWVAERIEAARLYVEIQEPMLEAGCH